MNEPDSFHKLEPKRFPARAIRETAEGRYWSRFKDPVDFQQVGACTYIDFCPTYPYPLAVSSATRVLIYDSARRTLRRQLARFKDKAYSGSFRSDGRALVAGGEDGLVQIFDTNSRALLRQLPGHQKPVRVTRYAPDRLHVLSGADDATVRWWDIGEGAQLLRLEGHQDYVRAAAVSPADSQLWATGAYDHTCRLWDVRSSQEVGVMDHGAPVEAIAFLPSGGLVATAGGTEVCIWDAVGGSRLLHRISSHQKTVTSLALAPAAGPASQTGPRLLSGSLDGKVRVYELSRYSLTYTYSFKAAVLSLGVAHDASTLAVGLENGNLSLRKQSRPKLPPPPGTAPPLGTPMEERPRRLTASNYRYFLRGRNEPPAPTDAVIGAPRRVRIKAVDHFLKAFRYRDALDFALQHHPADVVAALFEELSIRAGLDAALGGRDADALLPVLDFVVKHIDDPHYMRQLIGVSHWLLDLYSPALGTCPQVDRLIKRLQMKVREEVELQQKLEELQGFLDPILAAAGMAKGVDVPRPQTPPLALEDARKELSPA
eukprot:jgi/Botrbrau1/7813/Bobra.0159s0241.1